MLKIKANCNTMSYIKGLVRSLDLYIMSLNLPRCFDFLGKSIKDTIEVRLKDIIKDIMNNQSDKGINKTVDLDLLSFFNSDPYFNFVYKKSERLCMAIYLITDFFPAKDSLKDSMRRCGTKILEVSLSLITASSAFRRDVLNEINGLCLNVISLSKVACNLGMASVLNHDVLEDEIKNFLSVIEERERPSTTGQGFVLDQNYIFNDNSDNPNKSNNKDFSKNSIEIHESKKSEERVMDRTGLKTDFVKSDIKIQTNTINSSAQNNNISQEHSRSVNGNVMQKNDRQKAIINIIKDLGETSIKDISDNIKGCSEKTIQRELNSLIYDGVLKKIGERRWSKYVLA